MLPQAAGACVISNIIIIIIVWRQWGDEGRATCRHQLPCQLAFACSYASLVATNASWFSVCYAPPWVDMVFSPTTSDARVVLVNVPTHVPVVVGCFRTFSLSGRVFLFGGAPGRFAVAQPDGVPTRRRGVSPYCRCVDGGSFDCAVGLKRKWAVTSRLGISSFERRAPTTANSRRRLRAFADLSSSNWCAIDHLSRTRRDDAASQRDHRPSH